MAASPAGAVLSPPPKVQQGHELMLALLGLLAVAALLVTATLLLDPRDEAPASRDTPSTTSPTYRPAPPMHRLGPAQPEFAG